MRFWIYNNCILKPGGVFKEDWCTLCQCINNAYICDNSSCLQKLTTEQIELTTEPNYVTTTEAEEIITTSTLQYTTKELLSTTEFITSTVKWPKNSTTGLPTTTTSMPEPYSTIGYTELTTDGIIFVQTTVSPPPVFCDTHQ